jgi:hypothetical protein
MNDWTVDNKGIWRRTAADGGNWVMWHSRQGWNLDFNNAAVERGVTLKVAQDTAESRDLARL